MKNKKRVWVDYGRRGDILEITLRDVTRAKIESWEINVNDKKRARQIIRLLKQKYNVDFGFDLKEERDIEWLP